MYKLTEKEKSEIAIEMLDQQPINTIGHVALLKLSKLAIETNAKFVEIKTEATIQDSRYECKMKITYKKLKNYD